MQFVLRARYYSVFTVTMKPITFRLEPPYSAHIFQECNCSSCWVWGFWALHALLFFILTCALKWGLVSSVLTTLSKMSVPPLDEVCSSSAILYSNFPIRTLEFVHYQHDRYIFLQFCALLYKFFYTLIKSCQWLEKLPTFLSLKDEAWVKSFLSFTVVVWSKRLKKRDLSICFAQ
jgi:hypothetical protein